MFIFTSICSLFISKKKEYSDESRFYRRLLEICTRLAIFFGRIHIHTTGGDMIPSDRKYLLVQNHRSNFDPILSWWVFRQNKLIFVTKPENFKQPIFGAIIWRLRFLGIDRENPRNALKTIVKAADHIKSGDMSVGLYPEGTRNWTDDYLLPFHNASLKIAQMAGCPIAVTTVRGSQSIAKNFPWHHSDVYFDVIGIIEPEEHKGMKTDELAERIRGMMLTRLEGNPR